MTKYQENSRRQSPKATTTKALCHKQYSRRKFQTADGKSSLRQHGLKLDYSRLHSQTENLAQNHQNIFSVWKSENSTEPILTCVFARRQWCEQKIKKIPDGKCLELISYLTLTDFSRK